MKWRRKINQDLCSDLCSRKQVAPSSETSSQCMNSTRLLPAGSSGGESVARQSEGQFDRSSRDGVNYNESDTSNDPTNNTETMIMITENTVTN